MNQLENYIEKLKKECPECEREAIYSYAFGGDKATVDALATLVFNGEKCGTTSLYQLYEIENERIPQVDEISVILDSEEKPIVTIKNTQVEILKFKEVTEQHAFTEGEGDKSLDYWRNAHWNFFINCAKENEKTTFDEESLVVFETFKVIYR